MIKLELNIVNNAKRKFYKLKKSNLSNEQLLDELQDLRDSLRGKYQMTVKRINKYHSIQIELNQLINQIDKYWWNLFTKGKAK